ncbi:MAG: three-Cys-motif partner protein TcmP [Deltaproteobacteria bacterium]|nr:three-Cys-motif partner protein TcmP [Deltaproteobacteria bacterium]
MSRDSFFGEQTEQSRVKARIVSKYFGAWANVMIAIRKRYPNKSQKIAYIDLYAGPGRYANGKPSTPIKVIDIAMNKQDIADRIVFIFNDIDLSNCRSLKKTIEELSGTDKLKYKPKVINQEVGEGIVKMFEETHLVPTLLFVDPWGYKGLSLRLVNSVLKDWGCDCIFFFNYNRINMGLANPVVEEHLNAIFGENRAKVLRSKLGELQPSERELVIMEELCQAIKDIRGHYTFHFAFKDERSKRTSHHLIFVSKHRRGYEIMKDIMARESTSQTQGVPSFECNPTDSLPQQLSLFPLSKPLDELQGALLECFSGQTLKVREIYERHSENTRYILKNYKEALLKLEGQGKITAGKHRKGTFGDNVLVTFPGNRG